MEQKEEESSKLMNDFIKLEDLRITHNTCISEVRLQKEKDARIKAEEAERLKAEEDARLKAEEDAAVKIQAISRGKQGRKEAGKLREEAEKLKKERLKERLNVIIKNFKDFIKKIKGLKTHINTTELNGVIE